MINLSAVVADLRAERERAQNTVEQIDAALAALNGLDHKRSRTDHVGRRTKPHCYGPTWALGKMEGSPKEELRSSSGPLSYADSGKSICRLDPSFRTYLRRKDRANSFANRESSSVLIITHVSKHNEASESGFTTTPSA